MITNVSILILSRYFGIRAAMALTSGHIYNRETYMVAPTWADACAYHEDPEEYSKTRPELFSAKQLDYKVLQERFTWVFSKCEMNRMSNVMIASFCKTKKKDKPPTYDEYMTYKVKEDYLPGYEELNSSIKFSIDLLFRDLQLRYEKAIMYQKLDHNVLMPWFCVHQNRVFYQYCKNVVYEFVRNYEKHLPGIEKLESLFQNRECFDEEKSKKSGFVKLTEEQQIRYMHVANIYIFNCLIRISRNYFITRTWNNKVESYESEHLPFYVHPQAFNGQQLTYLKYGLNYIIALDQATKFRPKSASIEL